MTFAAEIAKRSQRVEYFVTIEGIGWPLLGMHGDLSEGFEGDVWTTADINGDLAVQLAGAGGTVTVHRGLELPSSISESIDPRTGDYSLSGCDFAISDRGGWWASNYTPRKDGLSTTLGESAAGLGLRTWNSRVDLADGTNFAANDTVWIGGRELVKLGAKTVIGGGPGAYYSASSRGYLGTQQGSSLRRAEDYTIGIWPLGATVENVARWWWNRKAAIWAHVPGEAADASYLLWFGLLRGITRPTTGERWTFNGVGDVLHCINRKWKPRHWYITSDTVAPSDAAGTIAVHSPVAEIWMAAEGMRRRLTFAAPMGSDLSALNEGLLTLAAAYNYRCEPGGTKGMYQTWVGGSGVQAIDTAADTDIVESFCMVGSDIIRMLKRDNADGNTRVTMILAELLSRVGTTQVNVEQQGSLVKAADIHQGLSYAAGSAARFLLDNWSSVKEHSRWVVDGKVRSNVIDVALIFLTSMDTELWIGDLVAGSTASTLQVAAPTLHGSGNWVGKAVFIMEGPYKWEARTITGNSTSAITLERPLSGAPAAGVEIQIRNSIYDVLPIGWGLGVDSNYLDIGSLEEIRDRYLPDATVGPFILGTEKEIDIWKLVQENLLKPYGVSLHLDRSTRKLAGRYLTNTPNADGIEDYTSVTPADIVEAGRLVDQFVNPVGSVSLKVRAIVERFTRADTISGANVKLSLAQVVDVFGGATDTITLRSQEIENAFADNDLDKLETQALFCTRQEVGPLAGRLYGMVAEYSLPPTAWETSLSMRLWPNSYAGQVLLINWNNPATPVNPFTGVRGWTNVIGRIVSCSLPLDGMSLSFKVTAELLATKNRGAVAPAAVVTSKGNDGVVDYFVVENTNFVGDPDNGDRDWYRFAVGDLIQLRDITGANKENETIHSFGSNHSATPQGAANSRINVVGAIGSAIASGDNVTFQPWSAGNTTNMENHSAYATAAGALTGGDGARRYV